jgi:opacity protein-like surface antigen
MKSLLITSVILALVVSDVAAQTLRPKTELEVDATLGVGDQIFTGTLAGTRWHSIGKKRRLQLGYEFKLTNVSVGKTDYITAPSSLSRENSSFLITLFSPLNEPKVDTLTVSSGQYFMISAAFNARYFLSERWSIGMDIDVVGATFGRVSNGVFRAGSEGRAPSVESASPASFQLLLVGDNDIGNLYSEFYVSYELNEHIGLRAGLSHVVTEVTTDRPLTFDNDRFRRFSNLGFVGVSYSF